MDEKKFRKFKGVTNIGDETAVPVVLPTGALISYAGVLYAMCTGPGS
jgi:hypothetical protein